jgi:hypothetical protein
MDEGVEWQGESPFFLVVEPEHPGPEGNIGIDLDSPWMTEHVEVFSMTGTWWLVHKETRQPSIVVTVAEGDVPYFVRRHVGNLMAGREIVAVGMGKVCPDGTAVRNWIFPNGVVCGGDDVDIIAARMLAEGY